MTFEAVASGLIIGLVSGSLASWIWYLVLRRLRPKIKISPKISLTIKDDDGITVIPRIKIVNLTRRPLHDMDVTFSFEWDRDVVDEKTGKMKQLKVRKQYAEPIRINALVGNKDPDSDHCRRVRFEDPSEPLDVAWSRTRAEANKSSARLVVEVFARDSHSGVGALFHQVYASYSTHAVEGTFYAAESLEITADHHSKPRTQPAAVLTAVEGAGASAKAS